jgi:hypothetical protein
VLSEQVNEDIVQAAEICVIQAATAEVVMDGNSA